MLNFLSTMATCYRRLDAWRKFTIKSIFKQSCGDTLPRGRGCGR